jgi:hypothetical protein
MHGHRAPPRYQLRRTEPRQDGRGGVSHRRCGTCRYFEEGTLAGSGWCRHPQRRDLQHMVLVRKSELACRAGWDHDLWEPKESRTDRPPFVHLSGDDALTVERPALHPQPPIEETEGASKPGSRQRATPRLPAARVQLVAPPDETSTSFARPFEPRQRAETRSEDRRTSPAARAAVSPEQRGDIPLSPVHGWFQSGETEPFHVPGATPLPELAALHDGPEEPVEDGLEPGAMPGSAVVLPLPRCCRTCRDFRPVADGSDGWCSNPYAFPERTRVSAESLACYSSLGSWWLPSDDWWLQQADISHHGLPTPTVDEYLRHLLAERERVRRRASS